MNGSTVRANSLVVMPGLDPDIHSGTAAGFRKCDGMDRRIKSGDDDLEGLP
jgi:hypothetical protein